MDKETLNRLLDSIYELEGLVHLALAREDIPESLPSLIRRKGEQLSGLAKMVAPGDTGDVTGLEPAPETETETETEGVTGPVAEAVTEAVAEAVTEAVAETVTMPVTEAVPDPLPDIEPQTQGIPEVLSFKNGICEPRGRLVFSINDKYRFKRELFDNSDADFNNTLALVASMEGYDEAEDYFIGELQWDSKRQEVTDFLEILKKYFKA